MTEMYYGQRFEAIRHYCGELPFSTWGPLTIPLTINHQLFCPLPLLFGLPNEKPSCFSISNTSIHCTPKCEQTLGIFGVCELMSTRLSWETTMPLSQIACAIIHGSAPSKNCAALIWS